jgi:3-hydroxyisobutyrate dehydrogenase-like beta-hydroxyacid dehydrogenase
MEGSRVGWAVLSVADGDALVALAVGNALLGVGAELQAASRIAAMLEAMGRRVMSVGSGPRNGARVRTARSYIAQDNWCNATGSAWGVACPRGLEPPTFRSAT